MRIDASLVPLRDILELRDLYRQEMNCQIVHDSLHERGHFDSWLLRVDGAIAGYGSVGGYRETPRTTVKEFHVLPLHRPSSFRLFDELLRASGATRIAVQTNDRQLTLMFHDRATEMRREKILFHDVVATTLSAQGASLQPPRGWPHASDTPPTTNLSDDWRLEIDGAMVASGGIMLHYNPPYADLYMEVDSGFRQRGYGSYLLQELKRVCYGMGRIPAARCDPSNLASRRTLERAGFRACAVILTGSLPTAEHRG